MNNKSTVTFVLGLFLFCSVFCFGVYIFYKLVYSV